MLENKNSQNYVIGFPDVDEWVGGSKIINDCKYGVERWLKDRKERELSVEDIEHYQKMIKPMSETIRVMGEIDRVGVIN